MPNRRDPPPTDEGWYALHDFRRIDWDTWESAPKRDREHALEDGVAHLEEAVAVDDADEGATGLYSILGHKADLLLIHLRPYTHQLDAIERRFETTDLARYTERTTSYVSVTEASGYSERARAYFDGELDDESGLARYIRSRLYPEIPDWDHVCFYPMDKRRDPEQNWYDLSFEERAEHMDAHGEIGRDYGGRVTQMITGSIGLDDWEWGVTLWAENLVDVKELLYEMRFDPSTSQFAEFGPFYVGRRIEPTDLPQLLTGGEIGETEAGEQEETASGTDEGSSDNAGSGGERGGPPTDTDDLDIESIGANEVANRITTLGLTAEFDLDAGGYTVICYSTADAQEIMAAVDELRESFDHYDTHLGTEIRAESGRTVVVSCWETDSAAEIAAGFLTDLPAINECASGPLSAEKNVEVTDTGETASASDSIRSELAELDVYAGQPHGEDIYALVCYSDASLEELESEVTDLSDSFDRYDTHEGTNLYVAVEGDTAAVVSLWETEHAADTASDFLAELPGIVSWADEADGFGTMGMFYTVKSEYRDDFVETFSEVGDLLADMSGHRETTLLNSVEDGNEMFIASQWDAKKDAMEFFRSDAFSETVAWGRDVLADRPRHVFLA